MKWLEKFRDISLVAFLLAIGAIMFLLFLPIFILALPFLRSKDKENELEYQDFLRTQNEGKFLVYTNKTKSKAFVENEILPNLDKEIQVIYIEGKAVHTEVNYRIVNRLLYDQKVVGGFPWVIKIASGKPYYTSINNQLSNAIKENNPCKILAIIND